MPEQLNDFKELYLADFAPLIQLWAGICLLFFYTKNLLNRHPLNHLIDKVNHLNRQLINQYQGYASKYMASDNDIDADWEPFRNAIFHMAEESFFYSFMILIYIGAERQGTYGCEALQVTDTLMLIYMVCAGIFCGKKIFHTAVTAVLFSVFLLIVFFLYMPVNSFIIQRFGSAGNFWSRTYISLYTLFACLSPLFIVAMRLTWESFKIMQLQKSINNVKSEVRYFDQIIVGAMAIDRLPKKLRKKLVDKVGKAVFDNADQSGRDIIINAIQGEAEADFQKLSRSRGFQKSD